MANTPKALRPIDAAVVAILNELADAQGMTRRPLVEASGVGLNRLGIIMRGEEPPATVGELGSIAAALGSSASDVIAEAERRVSHGRARVLRFRRPVSDAASTVSDDGETIAASDTDIDSIVEAQQEVP